MESNYWEQKLFFALPQKSNIKIRIAMKIYLLENVFNFARRQKNLMLSFILLQKLGIFVLLH